LHAAALKGRTGGTGDRHQPFFIAQDDFAVGADVDEDRDEIGIVQAGRQHTRADVRAHVTGDARQTIDRRVGVNAQADFARRHGRDVVHGGDKRRDTDALGGDA
jgi:hypothetical protein